MWREFFTGVRSLPALFDRLSQTERQLYHIRKEITHMSNVQIPDLVARVNAVDGVMQSSKAAIDGIVEKFKAVSDQLAAIASRDDLVPLNDAINQLQAHSSDMAAAIANIPTTPSTATTAGQTPNVPSDIELQQAGWVYSDVNPGDGTPQNPAKPAGWTSPNGVFQTDRPTVVVP